jgi:hypothetical protein
LNPQGFPRWILSPVRLPVPPLSRPYWYSLCGLCGLSEIASRYLACSGRGFWGAQIDLLLKSRRDQVLGISNTVLFTNAPGLMPADHHCNPLWYPGPEHIPDRGLPEIMEQRLPNLGVLGRLLPYSPEIPYSILSGTVREDKRAECSGLLPLFPYRPDHSLSSESGRTVLALSFSVSHGSRHTIPFPGSTWDHRRLIIAI